MISPWILICISTIINDNKCFSSIYVAFMLLLGSVYSNHLLISYEDCFIVIISVFVFTFIIIYYLLQLAFSFKKYLVCVYTHMSVCMHSQTCSGACMCQSKSNLRKSVLSFHHICPGDLTLAASVFTCWATSQFQVYVIFI